MRLIAAFLLPLTGFAADLEFAGGVQSITKESIQIRRADGARINATLPRTGALSSDQIGAQYKTADIVQITCKAKDPDHCGELKTIRFLRPPTERERFLVLGSPPLAPPDAELERVRQVNLDHAKQMPSFIADETAKRYASPGSADPPVWRLKDTIKSDIVFRAGYPTREHIRINGKPLNKPQIPNVNWSAFFGTEIKFVFDPECPTELTFARSEEAHGKQLRAYVFTSPPNGCFGSWGWGGILRRQQYNAGRTGRVLVEDPGGGLIQYEERTTGYPKEFPVRSYQQTIVWDYVKIGDVSHLLPVTQDFELDLRSGDSWRITVEYKNHRRFEAATSITFK
ncbi:MAG TPA: hypothetical protein VIY49_39520 [Bryobacteraceae bacterium]